MRDEPPQLHDQRIVSGELRLTAEYGFASGWSVLGMMPLRALRTTIQYENLAGEPVQLDYENIHHRNETIIGPGDPWLMVQRGLQIDPLKLTLTLQAGASLPVGFTEPDPFQLALQGQPHEHIQFGTGTFGAVLGLSVRREFHVPFNGSWGGFGLAQLFPYANRYGYRAGNRYAAGADVAAKPGRSRVVLRAGVLALYESAESWASTPNPSEGNLGRTDVLLQAEAVWAFSPDWTCSLALRVPVFTRAVGAQLMYPGIAELGASRLVHLHGGGEEADEF